MNKPVNLDRFSPIEWIDTPYEGVDETFTLEPEITASKTTQAIFQPIIKNVLEEVFGFQPPYAWAGFFPFPGYFFYLRRLFQKKVLASVDPEISVEILDNILETEGNQMPSGEAEKIYDMLFTLQYFNEILESVYLRIWSCLKS